MPFKSSLSSFSQLGSTSPPSTRGSHPTPHPAKLAKKGISHDKTGHVRHHSSPNFGSDFAEVASSSGSARHLTGASEKGNDSTQKGDGEVVRIHNAEAQVEQFSFVLKALAEQVQKV